MIEILIIIAAFVVLRYQLAALESTAPSPSLAPSRTAAKLTQMVTYADRLYSERKWLAAEKAYLSVLKIDHKHVTAYSHLGIIYSTQKNMPDAIECFEIAARLRPSASTLHNLGLAYFDNKNYMKSVATFEKSIMFEPSAQRYVGLSKAWHKLSNAQKVVDALEHAAELDSSEKIAKLLEDARVDLRSKDQTPAAAAK